MVMVRLTKSRNNHCIILGIFLVVGGYFCNCTPITITRANDSLDEFTAPQINCNAFCSAKKSLFLRNTSSSCACKCDFNASTFVFKGDLTSSVCMDNINIRSTLGQCELLLDGNNKASLPVLDISIPGSMVLTGQGIGSSTCSVIQEHFLDNGTWVVGASGNLTTFRTDQNLFKWSSNPSVSPYAGRVVRVQIQCHVNTSCVMIKIQGQISYNVLTPVISTSIALHPSPTTRYVRSAHPTTSTNHGTSSLQFTRSKTKNIIPMKPETISPSLATVVTATSSAVVIPNGETKAVQDGCERGTWVFCHWFYLATAAVGVFFFLFLVIILISCVCIRRRRRTLRHQKPVFFKSGLTNVKDTDSSTELALIEMDVKPANEDHKAQNNEEAFYQNVPRREKPDKNQLLYRPLRSSDGRDSPALPGRFSFGSSTNEVMLYDDTTDSNQLIKRESGSQSSTSAGQRFRTFCPSPVVVQSKKEFLSNEAILDAEEEATYEIMETKTLPHNRKINSSDIESITGFDNRVFEEDDHRQSHYEVVSDEQPNYENLEENQPNYERMEEHRNGLGLNTQNEEKNCSGLDEEQENYETMDTFSGEEQPDYEIMEQKDKPGGEENSSLLYEKMGAHKDWHNSNHDSGNEEIEDEREYDIPVITEDEHESHYDIPELSLEVNQDPDEPDYHYAVNTGNQNKDTGLAVQNDVKHDDDGEEEEEEEEEEEDYVYANVPEIQGNNLREKIRNSWHPGEQQHVEEATVKREGQTVTAKPGADKRPSSWNTSTAGQKNEKTWHEEDDEELYSLPDDYSKPLPSCLLKGASSPQLKQTQAKNQVPIKQKQRSDKSNSARQANDQIRQKDGDVVLRRAHLGSPKTSKPVAKNNVPLSNMMKKNKSSLEQPENSKGRKVSTTGREAKKDRPEEFDKEKPSVKQSSTNRSSKYEGSTSSPRQPLSTSEEKQERRRRQPTSSKKQANDEPQKLEEYNQNTRWNHEGNKDKTTENDHTYEQPLYTNLVEMENEGQTLANENTDVQTEKDVEIDEQPLYENVGAMVSHVG